MENSQKINCHDVTPIREGRVITIVCVKTTVLEKCFEKKTKELVFESISRIKKSISRQDFFQGLCHNTLFVSQIEFVKGRRHKKITRVWGQRQVLGRVLVQEQGTKTLDAQFISALRISYFSLKSKRNVLIIISHKEKNYNDVNRVFNTIYRWLKMLGKTPCYSRSSLLMPGMRHFQKFAAFQKFCTGR